MNKEKAKTFLYFLVLLFLPSMTIELYSGSTPPVNYFNPLTIFFLSIAYGLPFILLRELKIRLHLTWQVMFLFPIIGIYIEGIFMQSFFNIAHEDLDLLSNLGVWLDVQWPWTIYLTIMHGIYSFIYPLFIIDVVFPNYKNVTVLRKKSTIASFVLITALTILMFFDITYGVQPMYANYSIHVFGTLMCILIIVGLVFLAGLFRYVELKKSPFLNRKRDHFKSFMYLILLLLGTHFMALIHVAGVIIAQLVLSILLLKFAFNYVYRTTREHVDLIPLYNGATLYFSLMAIMQSYGIVPNLDPPQGMGTVGLAFLLLMVFINIKYRFVTNRVSLIKTK